MHAVADFHLHCIIALLVAAAALCSAATLISNCATTIPRQIQEAGGETSRHMRHCQLMPESHYSYSVQTAEPAVDSLQSTTFSDVNNGLAGYFELDQSLKPPDTLWIILGGRFERRGHESHTCQRLAICGLTVDGLMHRLRLNVTLDLQKSYTMKIFKFTNGSKMCEAPQIRFFYTRSNASEMPLVQMAVRNCNNCSDFGNFKCHLNMYVRTDGWSEGIQVQVRGVFGDKSDRINFTDVGVHSRNGWTRRPFAMAIESTSLFIHLFHRNLHNDLHRRKFYMVDKSDKSLQSQLCQPALTRARCPTTQPQPKAAATVAAQPPFQTPPTGEALIGVAVAPLVALLLALLLLALIRRRLCPRSRRRLLLVFADAEAATAEAVGRFRRELRAADVIKRGRLRIGEFVGLRSLTPDMAKNSRLIIFISNDAKFSDFQLDSLSADVCLVLKTVLTEKHRTLGFYIRSGAQPPFTSDWASLSAKCLGGSVRDARACVNSLIMTLCDIESV